MCTFISLNVLETTLAVPYGIELCSRYTAMCGASCFPCHMLSPFYLSVDGLTPFNGNQPINGDHVRQRTGPVQRLGQQRPSVEQFLRNIAAVIGELLQHGLVQPHVHLCRVAHLLGRAPKFDRNLLPRGKAAIETH